ncbi:MAG: response regulator transcription factor [Chloroflexaceae bacterium]|nr:response regulator transcription factor [Chloroflexaceae bacterium]
MNAHVLVVEDDDTTRMTLAYEIQYAGYRVTQAANGEAAVDLLEQESFHVVLTDILMEQVDGIEVLYTARMQSYRPMVILLTGHGSLETAISALHQGAYAYLLKPCPPDKLLTCVHNAVKKHHAEQELLQATRMLTLYSRALGDMNNPFEEPSRGKHAHPAQARTDRSKMTHIGELTVGVHRREVWFQGQSVHVTPIEYALLRCLIETPGQARSYSEIARYTHQCDLSDADAQTLLSSHVHNLRKKLDPALLVNDRGNGYMLVVPASADPTE